MIQQATNNSKKLSKQRRRRGFIAIEWILVLTILVIGIVGGLSAVRNAILDELELRRRECPELEEFFVTGGVEPFFVKNLETSRATSVT